MTAGEQEISKRIKNRLGFNPSFFSVMIILLFLVLVFCVFFLSSIDFRIDQYAVTISSTIAAVISTMFGLTAASYAFVRNDIQSEEKVKPHYMRTLGYYRKNLWDIFLISLLMTVITVMLSFFILAFAQKLMSSTLFTISGLPFSTVARYENNQYSQISLLVAINLIIAGISVALMAIMNYLIFKREDRYIVIAKRRIKKILNSYDKDIVEDKSKYPPEKIREIEAPKYETQVQEFEKIHVAERLIERILKNHQGLGDAFSNSYRKSHLLTVVASQAFDRNYINKKYESFGLEEEKDKRHWETCLELAKQNRIRLNPKKLLSTEKQINTIKPDGGDVVRVYDDLLSYRDFKLVCFENGAYEDDFGGHILLKSIKKRTMLFFLRSEALNDMDLSQTKFSGGDLRSTNLSNCNLSNAKFVGANCENADFTNSRMSGMYFKEQDGSTEGVQLSYNDDGKTDEWNPYRSEEATRLIGATFKGSDLSRARLIFPGEFPATCKYPFEEKDNNLRNCINKFFPLLKSNFDRAKLFYSYIKNIDFGDCSFDSAQMFGCVLDQVNARTNNFSGAVLTNSVIVLCDFSNANFQDAVLSDAILARLNFNGARLQRANFVNASVASCNFEGAYCQDVSFKNISQSIPEHRILKTGIVEHKAHVHNLSFAFCTLSNTDFSGADISGSDFSNAVGTNCVFLKTIMKEIIFSSSSFNGSLFNGTKIQASKIENSLLCDALFIDTCFEEGILKSTDFSFAMFSCKEGVCFKNTTLEDIRFTNARGLRGKNFKDTDLTRVDFSGTNVSELDLIANNNKIKDCIF